MQHSTPTVLILMSTFNGEKYLRAQIDSILTQDYPYWNLLIRDDGSKDQTIDIINEYAKQDKRIVLIKDSLGNLKPAKSFSALMEVALVRSEEYIFFSDQDDVWATTKLTDSLREFNNLETGFGQHDDTCLVQSAGYHGTTMVDNSAYTSTINHPPLLIHSDLIVVNNRLQRIHDSYLQYEKIKRNNVSPLSTLLINNFVTGCTMGINRSLLKMATPIPDEAMMHDWWCALCAASTGKIGFIEKETIQYRQHSNNVVGSRGFYNKLLELITFPSKLFLRKKLFLKKFSQARQLINLLDSKNNNYDLINKFSNIIYNKNLKSRLRNAYHLKLQPSGSVRKFLFWFFITLT